MYNPTFQYRYKIFVLFLIVVLTKINNKKNNYILISLLKHQIKKISYMKQNK